MQIQLNTDNHVDASPGLARQVDSVITDGLVRFRDRITRVEVHLQDLNADKTSGDDKRCTMEARIAGHQPTSVSHDAASVHQAIDGACSKLARSLDHMFGKLEAKRRDGGARQANDEEA